jgi:hypothetical protein
MAEAKGLVNVYTCETCGKKHVTVNTAAGVTPMFIKCRGELGEPCDGRAVSAMYQVDQQQVPDYVWYKPSGLRGLSPDMREHVRLGGLLLRKADRLEQEALGRRSRRA